MHKMCDKAPRPAQAGLMVGKLLFIRSTTPDVFLTREVRKVRDEKRPVLVLSWTSDGFCQCLSGATFFCIRIGFLVRQPPRQ
jgi:hypothetical protein